MHFIDWTENEKGREFKSVAWLLRLKGEISIPEPWKCKVEQEERRLNKKSRARLLK